jgi:coatomer subunit beta'
VKKLFEIHLVDDETFKKEVDNNMDMKHRHVVKFIGYCAESSWETQKQPSGSSAYLHIN